MEQQNYLFENAQHALVWSTEVMRRLARPAISSIYERGLFSELEEAEQDAAWMGLKTPLPTEKDEKIMLVSEVKKALCELSETQQKLLHLAYYGDWYSAENLTKLLKLQEKMRVEQGKRLRLNHRYSVRQLATLMNKNYRTIQRLREDALADLTKILIKKGLVDNDSTFYAAG